jgi:cell division inhibitor SepF
MDLGAVRPIPVSSAKPQIVIPADFNDAQQLGDRFKASQPVIINLQGADLDLARRVIDFASGLCYGLGGQMERVASQVYLLTPNDVEVSDEDRRRITERGLGRR